LIGVLIFLNGCKDREKNIKTIEIKDGWQFRKIGDNQWYTATVPGCVHTDLIANGLMENPFYRDNEGKVQWVEPYCMGTLYWQLNDCWSAVSWSGIEYYGNWKALHCFIKKAYEDLLVSPVIENGKLKVFIVSDRFQPQEGLPGLKLVDFSGNPIWQTTLPCRTYISYIKSSQVDSSGSLSTKRRASSLMLIVCIVCLLS
jgi:beta-galactosidase/beta-glucuronidase